MTPTTLLTALLLVGGGTLLVLRSQPRRPNIQLRLRTIDGLPPPSRRIVVRAVAAGLVILAVPALPFVLAVAGAPPVALLVVTVAVLPMVVTIAAELHAGIRRSGMPLRVPLTAEWQRRAAGALVSRVVAPFPAPPLRRVRPRQRSRPPSLTSAGTGRRLLVVPPGTGPLRLWDIAESYLGARSRYRDILSLNRGRRSPSGAVISEDSHVEAGWTLLMPRDAIGSGLVDLPGDPRIHTTPGTADRGWGAESGASMVLTERPSYEPDPGAGLDDGPEPPPAESSPDPPAADGEPVEPVVGAGGALEHPPADLPWDLVHARLLADGLRSTLALRRSLREQDRPFGAGVLPLDAAAAAVDTAAELGADRWGAQCVDAAARLLPVPAPPVVAVRLLPDVVELALATTGHGPPPAPFTADTDGRTWRLPRDPAVIGGVDAARPSALPGLVSMGRDRGGWVLLDLAAARGMVALRGDTRATRMVATAIALELLTSRWSERSRVTMIGFGRAYAGLDPRLIVADRIDQVIDDVVSHAMQGAAPQFVVLAQPPPTPVYDLLRNLAERDKGAEFGVLVVGGGSDDRWVLDLDPEGVLGCEALGITVGAQALSTATAAAVVRLIRAETASEPADTGRPEPAPDLPRPVDPDSTEVVVRLFGEPGLDGPDGSLDADPVTVEIVAFLAVHGMAAPQEIAAAVFPFGVPEGDLQMVLKVVVELLATTSSGQPGLLQYDDGTLELTADVHADWHLFVHHVGAGRVDDALELLGRAGAAHGRAATSGARYGWLASVPLARSLPGFVADVAHQQVDRRLATGRPDLAAVAASAGLQAQPYSMMLRVDLQRSLHELSETRLGRTGAGS